MRSGSTQPPAAPRWRSDDSRTSRGAAGRSPSLQLHDEVEHVVHAGRAAWSNDHGRFALLDDCGPAQLGARAKRVAVVDGGRVEAVQFREVHLPLAFARPGGFSTRGEHAESEVRPRTG